MTIDEKMGAIQTKLNEAGIKIYWLKKDDSLRKNDFATNDFRQWHQALETAYKANVLTHEEAVVALHDLKEELL